MKKLLMLAVLLCCGWAYGDLANGIKLKRGDHGLPQIDNTNLMLWDGTNVVFLDGNSFSNLDIQHIDINSNTFHLATNSLGNQIVNVSNMVSILSNKLDNVSNVVVGVSNLYVGLSNTFVLYTNQVQGATNDLMGRILTVSNQMMAVSNWVGIVSNQLVAVSNQVVAVSNQLVAVSNQFAGATQWTERALFDVTNKMAFSVDTVGMGLSLSNSMIAISNDVARSTNYIMQVVSNEFHVATNAMQQQFEAYTNFVNLGTNWVERALFSATNRMDSMALTAELWSHYVATQEVAWGRFPHGPVNIQVRGVSYGDANGVYTPVADIGGYPAWSSVVGPAKYMVKFLGGEYYITEEDYYYQMYIKVSSPQDPFGEYEVYPGGGASGTPLVSPVSTSWYAGVSLTNELFFYHVGASTEDGSPVDMYRAYSQRPVDEASNVFRGKIYGDGSGLDLPATNHMWSKVSEATNYMVGTISNELYLRTFNLSNMVFSLSNRLDQVSNQVVAVSNWLVIVSNKLEIVSNKVVAVSNQLVAVSNQFAGATQWAERALFDASNTLSASAWARYAAPTNITTGYSVEQFVTNLGALCVTRSGVGGDVLYFAEAQADTLYATCTHGFYTYDISCPTNPVQLAHYTGAPAWLGKPQIQGRYMFARSMSAAPGSLEVYDVLVPEDPKFISSTIPPNPEVNPFCTVVGKYLYLGNNYLSIYDISDVYYPISLAHLNLDMYQELVVDHGYIYGGNYNSHDLHVLDATNRNTAVNVSTLVDVYSGGRRIKQGSRLYIAGADGAKILNVADPTSVSVLATIRAGKAVGGLALQGDVLVVGNMTDNTLEFWDVRNLADLKLLRSVAYTSPYSVGVAGRFLYVCNASDNTLSVYDGGGIKAHNLTVDSVSAGELDVLRSTRVHGDAVVGNSLSVGLGGLNSDGPVVAPFVRNVPQMSPPEASKGSMYFDHNTAKFYVSTGATWLVAEPIDTNAASFTDLKAQTFAVKAFTVEPVSRSITVALSDSQATIQGYINGIGKYIPYGVTISILFDGGSTANGGVKSRDLASPLSINGFWGGGVLELKANNATLGSANTNQAIMFKCASGQGALSLANNNLSQLLIQGINFQRSVATEGAIYYISVSRSSYVEINECMFRNTTDSSGRGLSVVAGSNVQMFRTMIGGLNTLLRVTDGAAVYFAGGSTTGTIAGTAFNPAGSATVPGGRIQWGSGATFSFATTNVAGSGGISIGNNGLISQ